MARALKNYRSYSSLDERLKLVEGDSGLSVGSLETPSALSEKAYRALHIGFVALPIIAGVDKFTFILTEWTQYLAPALPRSIGVSPQSFVQGVGVLEIVFGIGLLMNPRRFGDIFALWITFVTANLIWQGDHYDVALFNFGLAAAACALSRLGKAHELENEGEFIEFLPGSPGAPNSHKEIA